MRARVENPPKYFESATLRGCAMGLDASSIPLVYRCKVKDVTVRRRCDLCFACFRTRALLISQDKQRPFSYILIFSASFDFIGFSARPQPRAL